MSARDALTLALLLASASSATPQEAPSKAIIAGSVEDADGYAVAGAFVIAQSRTTSFGETPEPARTDRAGRFHIELNDEGVHDVTVRARGYVTWRGRKLEPGAPLRVVLQRGTHAIEGVVLDVDGGAPT